MCTMPPYLALNYIMTRMSSLNVGVQGGLQKWSHIFFMIKLWLKEAPYIYFTVNLGYLGLNSISWKKFKTQLKLTSTSYRDLLKVGSQWHPILKKNDTVYSARFKTSLDCYVILYAIAIMLVSINWGINNRSWIQPYKTSLWGDDCSYL